VEGRPDPISPEKIIYQPHLPFVAIITISSCLEFFSLLVFLNNFAQNEYIFNGSRGMTRFLVSSRPAT